MTMVKTSPVSSSNEVEVLTGEDCSMMEVAIPAWSADLVEEDVDHACGQAGKS